ncbi:MAG: hypothetical protein EBZ47_09095 [Chlamydiae bacterium]|nr:hypothetical protein [Chlamydiota bacterium]NDD98732.1 hypothetical protein [bacterium]
MSAPIDRRGRPSPQEPHFSKTKEAKSFDPTTHLLASIRDSSVGTMSKKELLTYKNALKRILEDLRGKQTHLPLEQQIKILNQLIQSKAIVLKLNGQQVEDLMKSPFKNFSLETQEAVLHATFFYDAYDQTLNMESYSLENLHHTLHKPVLVDWKIKEENASFHRIAVAIKASASSPTNPSSIEIKGTG